MAKIGDAGIYLIDGGTPSRRLSDILSEINPSRVCAPERFAEKAKECAASLNVPFKLEPALRGWSADRGEESKDARDNLRRFSSPGWRDTPPIGGGEPFVEYQLRVLEALNDMLDIFGLYHRSLALLTDRRTMSLVEAWLDGGKKKVGSELELRDDMPSDSALRVYKERGDGWSAERCEGNDKAKRGSTDDEADEDAEAEDAG
jgi:hypothetical protein